MNRSRTVLAAVLAGTAVLAVGCGPARLSGQGPDRAKVSAAVSGLRSDAGAAGSTPTSTTSAAGSASAAGTAEATPASSALSADLSALASAAAQASAAAAGVDSELSQSTPSSEGTVP